MCGGYTRVCVRCGLCGKVDPRPLNTAGTCPMCGQAAEPGAQHCSVCGARIPREPGEEAHSSNAHPDITGINGKQAEEAGREKR